MKRVVGSAVCIATLSFAGPAHASGFLAARFGGEHGHPVTDNPSALYYNPAGLSLLGGTRLYLDGTFAYRYASYTRPRAAIGNVVADATEAGTPEEAVGANAGKAELNNFIASPMLVIVSDLGVENLGVAAGVFVPFGGTASWGRNEDFESGALADRYPGADDGVQRWWTMDGTIQSMYVSAGVAYRFPGPRLSLGASFNMVNSKVETIRARNGDGSDDMVFADGELKEGRSYLDVSGWNPSIGVGAIWEPAENLRIGASYQSQPGFGEISLDGTLSNTLGTGTPSVTEVELKQTLPDVLRLGVLWRPEPKWELRLFGEYAQWSVFENQCIVSDEDPDEPEPSCRILGNGAAAPDNEPDIVQNIRRDWQDAFGVRAGASYWFDERLEGWLGAGYDSSAIPDDTLDPALMDMPKITAAIGAGYDFLEGLGLDATFTQVIYFPREISVEEALDAVAPSGQPNAAGEYGQSISVLNLNLTYAF